MSIDLETAQRFGNDLIRVVKLFTSMRHHLPRLHPGAEPSAYPLLFQLSREPRRVSALAECVHSEVSTVSRQVSGLVSHGLAEKVQDEEDRRASVVTLTPEGRDLIDRLVAGRSEWLAQLLDGWEREDVEAFDSYLGRFGDSLQEARDRMNQQPHPDLMTAGQTTVTADSATTEDRP
ncbi:MAG TPA: MarR family transcriptional regulator [Segeticoccus sp.]|uniref:MarR family winged helix-turn-helix transcriptional regulator n=1 Tax=Segeticoccus sp. TaxID=2706531 RepID=UPI002D7F85DF|nr:MarR family transcriptional regulator [Segeticoccus sp.]HET8602037.1 MarR family transcriptional regulator [Segeticoccus sp.]